ncbi:ATP-dependent protease ATP-binding subunit, partial [Reticulomyxa filosa]
GRLPVRVELTPLTKSDMHRILTETEFNLIQQQIEMLKTENCKLSFTSEAISEIADIAVKVNDSVENIGARRLITVIEKVMEDINVEAAEGDKEYVVDAEYVKKHLGDINKAESLEKYIL